MSWVKKIIAFFNADDIEENEIKHTEIKNKKVEKKQPSKSDMNTRVTYQYPKGEFRFPLIPDPPKQKEQNNHVKVQPYSYEETKKENVQTQAEKKMKSVRPFKPEQIPSPIYGYQTRSQPKVKEEVVDDEIEYELEHSFIQKKVPKNESRDGLHKIKEEYQEVTMFEQNHLFAEPIHSQPEIGSVESKDLSERHVEQQSVEPVQDFVGEPIKAVQQEIPIEEESQVLEENHNENQVLEQEQTENQVIEQGEDQISEHELEQGQSESLALEQEREPVQEKVTNQQVVQVDAQNESQIQEQNLDQQSADQYMKDDEDNHLEEKVAANQQQERKRPKNPVPFNVLMLKQDRERLKRDRRQRTINRSEQIQEREKNEKMGESDTRSVERQKVDILQESQQVEELTNHEHSSESKKVGYYEYPSPKLLAPPVKREENNEWITEQIGLLNETLQNFNVNAQVVKVSQGPSVTRFEVQPEPGVKVSRIKNLTDDIKLSMAAKDIRMEAPIPGKRSIGIEIPNVESRPVLISELIDCPDFLDDRSPLTAVLGLDISGTPIITDLNKMPHGLIAGATGSGKSVCINSILVSLLYKARPDELKLLLIDPKMVELAPYNHIPHLISPVITDVKAATASLKWAVDEMERRYELFAHTSVRDIRKYNELAERNDEKDKKLPFIVVVIDELADLMMMAPTDVEESISRIAQKARACGIHLLIATQRPSVDVITGLIKANVPTRVAFSVSSQVDSRTIIDIGGAEKLLGRGDMLFLENGSNKPIRVQGTFVSDEEIDCVIEHVRKQGKPQYIFEQEELLKKAEVQNPEDELFYEACEFIIEQGSASTSLLQRQFRIGYNRAARLMDMLEDKGIISEARGSRARDVLITESDLEEILL